MNRGAHPTVERERGSALIMVLLVMVILTLLGVPFLLMGETENRITENERLSLQAQYAAEAGARVVKRWFDDPMGPSNVANPPFAILDLSQRMIDADGDPATAPVAADGSAARPRYKQGVDADGDGYDDVFAAPYTGGLKHPLLGTEAGPDIVIDEAHSGTSKTWLVGLSANLLPDYPGSGQRARITRIDVYAPPTVRTGGSWERFGIATAKVSARVYQEYPGGTERVLAERTVRVVLDEVQYAGDVGVLGPLHSCGDLAWNGPLTVHWGAVLINGNADLPDQHENRPAGLPRAYTTSVAVDRLWAFDDFNPWNDYFKNTVENLELEIQDPWFRLFASGFIHEAGGSGSEQPWPFDWTEGDSLTDGKIPYHPSAYDDTDLDDGSYDGWEGVHANLFQYIDGIECPSFPYETWKAVALAGGANIHYYSWDSDDRFWERGAKVSKTFQELTDGKTGLFFFDTTDGLPPHDDDGDGVSDNLTPAISIWGGDWGVRGMIYLNAQTFQAHSANGIAGVPFQTPGEPFFDDSEDGVWDSGEPYLNLEFMTGDFDARATDHYGDPASPVYNARGKPTAGAANLWGILYNSGYFDSRGVARYYGSVVAKAGVSETGAGTGTPDIYWDPSLLDEWPPEAWGLPSVVVTRWATDG